MTRNRKPWLVLVAIAGGVAGANAQDNEMERRMLACDALTNESDRLACFNNVVQSLRPGAAEEPTVAPDSQPEPTPASTPASESAPAAAAEPTPVAAPAPDPMPVAEPSPEPDPMPVAEPSPEPEPVTPAQRAMPAAAQPSDVAAAPAPKLETAAAPAAPAAPAAVSQVSAPPADAEEFKENNVAGSDLTGGGVIVRVWERHDGRFTVKLNNGQHWRETEGTRVGIPDVGDEVTVSRGLFGSYRMKIDGIARVAWVRPDE